MEILRSMVCLIFLDSGPAAQLGALTIATSLHPVVVGMGPTRIAVALLARQANR